MLSLDPACRGAMFMVDTGRGNACIESQHGHGTAQLGDALP